MRKSISLTRADYKKAYAIVRRANGHSDCSALRPMNDEIVDCALISYCNCLIRFDGWVNRKNLYKWHCLIDPNYRCEHETF